MTATTPPKITIKTVGYVWKGQILKGVATSGTYKTEKKLIVAVI